MLTPTSSATETADIVSDPPLHYTTVEVDIFLANPIPREALERFNRIMQSVEQHGLRAEARPDWNGTIVVGQARGLTVIDAAELVLRACREAGIAAGIRPHADAMDRIMIRRADQSEPPRSP